jgi:ABC-type transport system involved in cytochrome bd biosynthesis fused ATPase/permease subunit
VLLLDEPVAHLDHATADAVMGDLTRSATGQSVIMVSHRRDGLSGFDRVIDLSQHTGDPVTGSEASAR